MKIFNFVWDLRVLPATFDYICAIVTAYSRAYELSGDSRIALRPIIITGDLTRKSDFSESTDTNQETIRRIDQILLPILSLFEFVIQPTIIPCSNVNSCLSALNKYPIILPSEYNFQKPKLYRYYKPFMWINECSKRDLRLVKNHSKDLEHANFLLGSTPTAASKKKILISERSNIVTPDTGRDTPVGWIYELASLLEKDYQPIILPDYLSKNLFKNTLFPTIPEAAFNLRLRSALFEVADLNIFGTGGFFSLAAHQSNSCYIFVGTNTSNSLKGDYLDRQGYIKDTNMVFRNSKSQQWIWDLPTPSDMVSHVKKILN